MLSQSSLAVYTYSVSRRFIALLIVFVVALQGPALAYAAASTVSTTTTHCCPGHELGNAGNGCNSCPAGVLAAGGCCAGCAVFIAMPSSQLSLWAPPLNLLPSESRSVSFDTESPTPQIRPPIV